MMVVTLLRKPLIGTVASNSLAHGTGGVNIDASRISTTDSLNGGAYASNASDRPEGYDNWRYKRGDKGNVEGFVQPTGRWPANLIVEHLPGCKITGAVKSSYMINQWTEGAQPFGKAAGKPYEGSTHEGSCDVWSCAEGCAVGGLNASAEVGGNESEREAGVARFFKQVKK